MALFNVEQWRQHVALDVGTATTRIATGNSQLFEIPSRFGAKKALRNGVVVDSDAAHHILEPLLECRRLFGIVKPTILGCAPTDASDHERGVLEDCIMKAGAASVSIIPEPLAAAVGAGLDVSSPYAQMVVDIGEGVTDCAVIRSGRLVASYALRGGCCRMREAIAARQSAICEDDADLLLSSCGICAPEDIPGSLAVAAAVQPVLEEIADGVDSFLRDLPDELGCDIIYGGICLTGGGALVPGVRRLLEEHTGVSITRARNPRRAVVEGARAILPVVVMLNRWK